MSFPNSPRASSLISRDTTIVLIAGNIYWAHYGQHFIGSALVTAYPNPKLYAVLFIVETTEARRGYVTRPESHSLEWVEVDLKYDSPAVFYGLC